MGKDELMRELFRKNTFYNGKRRSYKREVKMILFAIELFEAGIRDGDIKDCDDEAEV